MNHQLTLILLLFLAIFTCCNKNKSVIIQVPGFPYLDTVKYDPELTTVYIWNDNKLIREKSKHFYTAHNYNPQNQLISSDYYVDPSIYSSDSKVFEAGLRRTEWVNPKNTERELFKTYQYNPSGQLIEISIHRLITNYESYSTFEHNGNGQISKETWTAENKIYGINEFSYDNAGNLILKSHFNVSADGSSTLSTTTAYEFDQQKNPYLLLKMPEPGQNTNQNNILKETYTIYFEVDPSIDKVQIVQTTYEYNDKGYPTKKNGMIDFIYN